jgi:hypothetical protein
MRFLLWGVLLLMALPFMVVFIVPILAIAGLWFIGWLCWWCK